MRRLWQGSWLPGPPPSEDLKMCDPKGEVRKSQEDNNWSEESLTGHLGLQALLAEDTSTPNYGLQG